MGGRRRAEAGLSQRPTRTPRAARPGGRRVVSARTEYLSSFGDGLLSNVILSDASPDYDGSSCLGLAGRMPRTPEIHKRPNCNTCLRNIVFDERISSNS